MTFALSVASDKYQDVINSGAFSSERLALAGEMLLVGVGMVFAVLAVLWIVLTMFKFVFAKPEKKAAPAPQKVEVTEPVAEAPAVEEATDDGELIAVITAAVAAYIASEDPQVAQSGFRVVSFRRANGGRAWNSK